VDHMKAQRALTEVETELSLALQNRTSGMLDVGRLLNEATHIESDGGRDRVGRERRFLLRAIVPAYRRQRPSRTQASAAAVKPPAGQP
jgi:hypothetical protein